MRMLGLHTGTQGKRDEVSQPARIWDSSDSLVGLKVQG